MQPQIQNTTTTAKRNKGVLPMENNSENPELLNNNVFSNEGSSDVRAKQTLTSDSDTDDFSDSATVTATEQPFSENTHYPHIRHPKAHRSGTFIVMAVAAVCGVAGGIVVSANGSFSEAVSVVAEKPFGEIFLMRLAFGAALLAVEFVLGFFALGDLLVWVVPLFAGLGAGFRIAQTKAWECMPSYIVLLGVITFAAAVSAGFSATLMSLARGGTIHLGSSPRRVFVLNYLGYLAAIAACALYEGIILTVNR